MVNVRPSQADQHARFNVLLTRDRPHSAPHWTNQLPRLLEPQGVASYLAESGRQAIDLAETLEIHAAVIDLGTPRGDATPIARHGGARGMPSGGLWLLELMRRMPNHPPLVVINSPAYSQRQLQRMLQEALRLGAFCVLNQPVGIEQLLNVFRRLLDRHYRGTWPSPPATNH